MRLTLLLDLDDTLLRTNMQDFIPAYFQSLSNALSPYVASDLMVRALLNGTHQMNESRDSSRTLQDVFESRFYPCLQVEKSALQAALDHFYDHVFPSLGGLTAQIPEAVEFVEWAVSKGFRIAIATDPLFPRKATWERIRWAGLDPSRFEVVSTFEDFHFSKTYPAYYAEVLGRMGWPEGPILMVGNDLERDIRPAQALGLKTFHVEDESVSGLTSEAGIHGSLSDLREWLESADLKSLLPSYKKIDSILSILTATPAILNGLLGPLNADQWSMKSTAEDWSLTEFICHLRDTEIEIHHMQVGLFSNQNEPFIPRPDTRVWASQRDYQQENGPAALLEFAHARRGVLENLQDLPVTDWERRARHAIFGPTNFLEVVGFFTDHDQMHIQQAWAALRKLENIGKI